MAKNVRVSAKSARCDQSLTQTVTFGFISHHEGVFRLGRSRSLSVYLSAGRMKKGHNALYIESILHFFVDV